MNALEHKLSEIMDSVRDIDYGDDPQQQLEAYEEVVDESACTDESVNILMREVVPGTYDFENLYLVERMMEQAESIIRLYVDNLDKSIYGNVIARNLLKNWLAQDEKRKVKILVRQGRKFKSSHFYATNREFVENGRIEYRLISFLGKCSTYAGIFDEKAIKVKIKGDDKDTMLGNFHSEIAADLCREYDKAFDGADTHSNLFLLAMRNAVPKLRSEVSSQKDLIARFTRAMVSKIEDSLKNHGGVNLPKNIKFNH